MTPAHLKTLRSAWLPMATKGRSPTFLPSSHRDGFNKFVRATSPGPKVTFPGSPRAMNSGRGFRVRLVDARTQSATHPAEPRGLPKGVQNGTS
jgi:hypothetical protein